MSFLPRRRLTRGVTLRRHPSLSSVRGAVRVSRAAASRSGLCLACSCRRLACSCRVRHETSAGSGLRLASSCRCTPPLAPGPRHGPTQARASPWPAHRQLLRHGGGAGYADKGRRWYTEAAAAPGRRGGVCACLLLLGAGEDDLARHEDEQHNLPPMSAMVSRSCDSSERLERHPPCRA